MMATLDPFAPADGIKARWYYCYELVDNRKSGEQITYEEVEELLDCDRQTAQAAMLTAHGHLCEDGKLGVRTVAKFGWVRMTPAEHIKAAAKGEKKMWRAQVRASRPLNVAERHREELAPFDRQALDRSQARHQALERFRSTRRRSFAELEEASRARELEEGRGA